MSAEPRSGMYPPEQRGDYGSRSPAINHDFHGRYAFGSAAPHYEQFGERGPQQQRYREVDLCRIPHFPVANYTIPVNYLVILSLRGLVVLFHAAHRFHVGTALTGARSAYTITRHLVLFLSSPVC